MRAAVIHRLGGRRRARAGEPDAGVVALVVALSVSTFLLGFAALALDLGQAFTRRSQLQSVADRLALAGAEELPSIDDALSAVAAELERICPAGPSHPHGHGREPLPGVCDVPASWARDADPDNGEVTFYADRGQRTTFADLNHNGEADPGDNLSAAANRAQGIRVTLPPSTVQFGFAATFGADSVAVSTSATARIGTALGLGLLPFALTPADVERGEFCIRDPDAYPGSAVPPATGQIALSPLLTLANAGVAGQRRVFVLTTINPLTHLPDPSQPAPGHVRFHFETSPAPVRPVSAVRGPPGSYLYSVPVPLAGPGTETALWATGRSGGRRAGPDTFATNAGLVRYSGSAAPGAVCDDTAQADRGYTALARRDLAAGADPLPANIRTGPQVKLYPSGNPLGVLGSVGDCVAEVFSPASTCLSGRAEPFSDQLADGLLTGSGNAAGRLVGDCGGGRMPVNGYPGVDASQLLTGATPLVHPGDGSADDLRKKILSGPGANVPAPSERGWISSRVLSCPRLAVLPVIDPDPLHALAGGQPILSFSYVWIDDVRAGSPERGLNFTAAGRLGSIQGYVVDPRYLPAEVAGSPVVGPYLGADLPKEALLVHDLGASTT